MPIYIGIEGLIILFFGFKSCITCIKCMTSNKGSTALTLVLLTTAEDFDIMDLNVHI